MDNVQFGQFIADLRKERGLTQKELAALLNVTDKAVSKWETGKGYPDIKLLEELARALGITLVELIQCQRSLQDTLTVDQAEAVVSQALDQSQKVTALRYLKLLRWLLVVIGLSAAYTPVLYLITLVFTWIFLSSPAAGPDMGIIGGADGPTVILVSSFMSRPLLSLAILCAIALASFVLVLRVRKAERSLR